MKFFLLLAFGVVFLTVFTRADDEEEKEEEEEDDDEPQAMSSAMQLNGNNVGDINNIKVNWNGELHNMMTQDIFSVILGLLNNQKIIEHAADDDEEDEEEEDE